METADHQKGEDQWEISTGVFFYDLEGLKTKTDSKCCNDNFQKNDMLLFDDKDGSTLDSEKVEFFFLVS